MTQKDKTSWTWCPEQYDWIDFPDLEPGDEIAIIYIDEHLIVTAKPHFDPQLPWAIHTNKYEQHSPRTGLWILETDRGTFYLDSDDSIRRRIPHARAEKGV